jgi:bla regulator protein blaR1
VETLLRIGIANAAAAAILAPLAAIVGRASRRPALAHGLWLLVLLKLVTPPLVPVPIPWPSAPVPSPARWHEATTSPAPEIGGPGVCLRDPDPNPDRPSQSDSPAASLAPIPAPPTALGEPGPAPEGSTAPGTTLAAIDSRAAALTVWLVGSSLWVCLAAVRIGRFRRLLRHAATAPAELQARAEELADRLGLARCPEVRLVPGPVSPMVWALGGPPQLLLPRALWDAMPESQRDALLVHELAHLRRRDHWVRWLELAAGALYWWHPVAWWARRSLREAEEQCCDAWVVWALPRANRAYAAALLEAVDFLSGARNAVPLATSGMGQVHHLKRRLMMIKRGETPRALSRAGSLAVWGLAAVLLPLAPAWAQPAPPRAENADDEPAAGVAARQEERARNRRMAERSEQVGQMLEEARENVARLERQLREARARLEELQAHAEEDADAGLLPPRRNRSGSPRALRPASPAPAALPPGHPPIPPVPPAPALPSLPSAAPAAPIGLAPPSPAPAAPAIPGAAPVAPAAAPPPPPGAPPAAPLPRTATGSGRDQEHRLRELERKFDRILEELESLKKDRGESSPRAERPSTSNARPVRTGTGEGRFDSRFAPAQ